MFATTPGLSVVEDTIFPQRFMHCSEMKRMGAEIKVDAGRAVEAEQVYRRDLEQYPSNGWSLFGLSRSLKLQRRGAEADWVQKGFENAWARADVELSASRF